MIIQSLVLVLSLIGLGSLMRHSKVFPKNTADVLNAFVLYVSLPAIILISIPELKLNSEMFIPIGVHWVMLIIHVLILYILYKWIKFSRSVFGALLIVTTMGNTAFLGIPLVKGFYGIEAVAYAVLFDQLGSGLTFIIFGAFVLPVFVGGQKQDIKTVLKNLFTFPAFLALLGGFLFMAVPMPQTLHHVLSNLSATLIPCAMVAVGFQMKYRFDKSALRPLLTGLWVKLLILPLIILSLTKLIGLDSMATDVSVLQTGMPPMITAGAMAINANLEKDLSASLVGYGLIFSFAAISLLKFFI